MTLYALAPALPLHKAGPYVAAAYIVFLAILLIYVAIMARRLIRTQRELAELKRELLERDQPADPARPAERPGADREVSRQL